MNFEPWCSLRAITTVSCMESKFKTLKNDHLRQKQISLLKMLFHMNHDHTGAWVWLAYYPVLWGLHIQKHQRQMVWLFPSINWCFSMLSREGTLFIVGGWAGCFRGEGHQWHFGLLLSNGGRSRLLNLWKSDTENISFAKFLMHFRLFKGPKFQNFPGGGGGGGMPPDPPSFRMLPRSPYSYPT